MKKLEPIFINGVQCKVCSSCDDKTPKPLSAFNTSKKEAFGRASQCKKCKAKASKNRKAKIKAQNILNPPQVTEKYCERCKENKLANAFSLDIYNKDNGLCKWCKDCFNAYHTEYRSKHIDKIRECSKMNNRKYALLHIEQRNLNPIEISEKRCYKCDHIREIALFNKNSWTLDGYNAECNICRIKYRKEHTEESKVAHQLWRAKNMEYIKLMRKQKYWMSPERNRLNALVWHKTINGRISARRKQERRRGFNATEAINERFENGIFHHFHIDLVGNSDTPFGINYSHDDLIGIYVPKMLHLTNVHASVSWYRMDEVNIIFWEWLATNEGIKTINTSGKSGQILKNVLLNGNLTNLMYVPIKYRDRYIKVIELLSDEFINGYNP